MIGVRWEVIGSHFWELYKRLVCYGALPEAVEAVEFIRIL